jgi:hypothetical protein
MAAQWRVVGECTRLRERLWVVVVEQCTRVLLYYCNRSPRHATSPHLASHAGGTPVGCAPYRNPLPYDGTS